MVELTTRSNLVQNVESDMRDSQLEHLLSSAGADPDQELPSDFASQVLRKSKAMGESIRRQKRVLALGSAVAVAIAIGIAFGVARSPAPDDPPSLTMFHAASGAEPFQPFGTR